MYSKSAHRLCAPTKTLRGDDELEGESERNLSLPRQAPNTDRSLGIVHNTKPICMDITQCSQPFGTGQPQIIVCQSKQVPACSDANGATEEKNHCTVQPSWEKCTAPPHILDLRSNLQLLKWERSTREENVRNNHTETSLLLKELRSVVAPHAGAGTNEEQDNWNHPYGQDNWKHWDWMAETVLLGVAKSITHSPSFSCAACWLPGQIVRVDLTVKIKEAETQEQRREKMYINTFI